MLRHIQPFQKKMEIYCKKLSLPLMHNLEVKAFKGFKIGKISFI